MDRRTFLAAVGAVGVAGCVGNSGASSGEPGTATPSARSEDATPTPLSDDLLAVEGEGTVTGAARDGEDGRTFAAAKIENVSDRPIGKVTATAEWLDASGEVASTTDAWLYQFEPGAVWQALVPADGETAFDDARVIAEPIGQTIDAGALSLADSEMTTSDGAARIAGTVSNDGDEDVFPTIFGKFYDGDSTIVGGVLSDVTNSPAGQSKWFDLAFDYAGRGLSAPAEYEVVLDTPDDSGVGCLCD